MQGQGSFISTNLPISSKEGFGPVPNYQAGTETHLSTY